MWVGGVVREDKKAWVLPGVGGFCWREQFVNQQFEQASPRLTFQYLRNFMIREGY